MRKPFYAYFAGLWTCMAFWDLCDREFGWFVLAALMLGYNIYEWRKAK